MALPKINHTQVSNDFIDHWLKKLKPTSSIVFLCIARKTIGWHKDIDVISQSQLSEMTGLRINTVKLAIKELYDFDIINVKRTGFGKGIKTYFEINYENISNISNSNISNFDIKNEDNILNFDIKNQINISNFDTTKEININKEYKEIYEPKGSNFKKQKESVITTKEPTLHKKITDAYFKAWEIVNPSIKPKWTGREAKELKNVIDRGYDEQTIMSAMELYFKSKVPFILQQGYSASYLFNNIDKILNGATLTKSQTKVFGINNIQDIDYDTRADAETKKTISRNDF